MFGIGGIVALGLGIVFRVYRGQGYTDGLSLILILAGAACLIFAIAQIFKGQKVSGTDVTCVYCQSVNTFTEWPSEDFRCSSCNRLVPLRGRDVLPVFQVRCGYCNSLNYYSEKTEVLICEECDREIPIANEEGKPTKTLPRGYAITDDDNMYELILTGTGHKNEELISALQHLLALNRNQVKQMLGELPVAILTGITRKKAEMIAAQLSIHEGATEMRALD